MIRPFGEQALLVETDGWQVAQALAASLAANPLEGVEGAVPALESVLVELDDSAVERVGEIRAALARRLDQVPARPATGRIREVPIVYGGDHGPDLGPAAAAVGLRPEELAARHAAAEARVMFCGFAPGFAYLGELPAPLHVPRLATPRTRTPAGSVAIAGAMTGIYPLDLPGGWQVIGRTPLTVFDSSRQPPAYLVPGDVVRWRPMDPAAWPDRFVTADDW